MPSRDGLRLKHVLRYLATGPALEKAVTSSSGSSSINTGAASKGLRSGSRYSNPAPSIVVSELRAFRVGGKAGNTLTNPFSPSLEDDTAAASPVDLPNTLPLTITPAPPIDSVQSSPTIAITSPLRHHLPLSFFSAVLAGATSLAL